MFIWMDLLHFLNILFHFLNFIATFVIELTGY